MSDENDLNLFRELFKDSPPTSPQVEWKSLTNGTSPEAQPVKLKGAPEIPDFEILALLGKGGMGAVYKARQIGMDRIVALKVMKRDLAEETSFIERFFIEARTAGKLRHENIVSALDCGYANGNYYMVMEYVEGRTLASVLREKGKLVERDALGLVRQVARGLQAAAENRVIHRDIKPENILVTPEGVAKICDLGLCRTLGDSPHLTMTGVVHCTAAYASPEQARADKDIDTRTDIYSLGVTLYFLVTGKLPFSGDSSPVILARHLTEKPKPPIEINEALTPGVNRLILDMMAKDRNQRPTAATVSERIQAILSNGGGAAPITLASPQRPTTTARPNTRRWREDQPRSKGVPTLAMVGVGVAALAIAIVIVTSQSAAPEPASSVSASARPKTPTPPPPPVERPIKPLEPNREENLSDLLSDLERYSSSSGDPDSILQRCDKIRPRLAGTPFEARLRAVEESARKVKESKSKAGSLDAFLVQIESIIRSDPNFLRKTEILALFNAASLDADIRKADVDHRRMEYEKSLEEAALRTATAIRTSAEQLASEKKFDQAFAKLDEYPQQFRGTTAGSALVRLARDLEQKRVEAESTAAGRVDLLGLIKIPEDVVAGAWTLKDHVLLSQGSPWTRIQVPYAPPEEYDLVVNAERVEGANCLDIGLISNGRQFAVELDGRAKGPITGLLLIDGKYTDENETTVSRRILTNNTPAFIRCRVRKEGVAILVDGIKIIDWVGKSERLSMFEQWKIGQDDCLFLGCFSSFRVSRMDLLPIAGQGKIVRPITGVAKPSPRVALKLAPPPDSKLPRTKEPSLQAQKESEKAVRETFRGDFAKGRREDKLASAQKFLGLSAKIDNLDTRFVLLREARDLALQGLDLQMALSMIDALAAQFMVDLWDLRLKALTKFVSAGLPPELLLPTADAAGQLAEEAVLVEEFAKALGFLAIAERLARDAQDPAMVQKIQSRAQELKALQKQPNKK